MSEGGREVGREVGREGRREEGREEGREGGSGGVGLRREEIKGKLRMKRAERG